MPQVRQAGRRGVRQFHSTGEAGEQGWNHIWQGRFKAFPIEQDDHLLTVLHYIERNPVRGKLTRRAQQWGWSSARYWEEEAIRPTYIHVDPVPRPADWLDWVNQDLTLGELEALRRSVNRAPPTAAMAGRRERHAD
jgi:putative transposase